METEALKLVSNLGSFGLMSIFVVWVLFRGAPMLKEMLKDLGDSHKRVMEEMATNHKESVESLTKDCAESQRELFKWLSVEMDKRDKALERMGATVERVGDRMEGCPHRDATQDELRRRKS